jgi:6-pyruvoyl-tetrahydropterin synthase
LRHEASDRTSTIFLHDITRIDCALFDPSKGIYGQSWRVDVTLTGAVGVNGIVFDFSSLKKLVRQTLKSSIDHALIIPINSQAVQFRGAAAETGECWYMRSRSGKGGAELEWEYKSPKGAVFPSRSVALNRQVVEQDFCRSLKHRLPEHITHVSVTLREEEAEPTEAVLRYTHGIGGHEGHCQRLLHGHRSRLQVFVGDERRPDLEHWIVRDVLGSNVHIASPSQFKAGPTIEPGTRGKGRDLVTLSYEASQGLFEATLPAERIFVTEPDTSIECLAQTLAQLVKREENTAERVKIICWEGIDRGSVAEL